MNRFLLSILISCLVSINLVGCDTSTEVTTEAPQTDTTVDLSPEIEVPNHEDKDELDNTASDTETDIPEKEEDNSNSTDKEQAELLENKQIMSRLFFYDIELDQMFYVDTEVDVIGGGYINSLTNALKNDQYGDHLITMADETFVTKADLDEGNGLLTVYFNETFHESMNLGSLAEVEMINALVNTYGYNYQVDKVAIIVEGKPYVDQRGEMPEGYFTVTSHQAIELN